jgi:multiple sugar transport system permease protein
VADASITGAGTKSLPRPEPRRRRRSQGQGRWSALFLSPALILIGVFTLIPIVMTFIISFHSWSMLTPITDMRWVGLQNYQNLFQDSNRIQALGNTGIYVVLSIVISVPLGLLIAMLLYFPKLKGQALVRVILFATYVIPTIAIVIIWGNIYAPGYGPLSSILHAVGLPAPGWLSDPSWALVSLVIFNVWQMLGYYVILLIAGLTQIPEDLYEAAKIDGAGIVRQTWSITIPMLSKTLVFVVLMTFINSVQVFDPIYLLTQGGPVGSTDTISYEIQRSAFSYGLAGQSSALAVTLFMAILVVGVTLGLVLRGRNK